MACCPSLGEVAAEPGSSGPRRASTSTPTASRRATSISSPRRRHDARDHGARRPSGGAPARLDRRPRARPVVLATLGNIFNGEDKFRVLLAAFADEPYNVVMTVGRSSTRRGSAHRPGTCASSAVRPAVPPAVACRRGGLPRRVQHRDRRAPGGVRWSWRRWAPTSTEHAERCAVLGVGRVIEGRSLLARRRRDRDPPAVLDDPSYRAAAARVQTEIAALPDVHGAVDVLERAAAPAGRPLDVHD